VLFVSLFVCYLLKKMEGLS